MVKIPLKKLIDDDCNDEFLNFSIKNYIDFITEKLNL